MRTQKGFTLLELMFVVAIVAILATVALPAWQNHLDRANRSVTQGFMVDVLNRAEQYRLNARSYPANLSALNVTVPNDVVRHFEISAAQTSSAPPIFTVTATPKDTSRQETMTAASNGERTPADKW